ncbi:MAG: carbonic anhydrase [Oscillospiraceae bacterium]
MIDQILDYNKRFVEDKRYEKFATSKYPDKKLAILSCMDTRLTELLPAALGLKNGDAKIIKNAGGVILHPFGSVVRSLLVAIVELGVTEIMVIGHTDCGVQHLDSKVMIAQLEARGIPTERIEILKRSGINFDRWLSGFRTSEESVRETVSILRNHPVIPQNVAIQGFVMDSLTGALETVPDAD